MSSSNALSSCFFAPPCSSSLSTMWSSPLDGGSSAPISNPFPKPRSSKICFSVRWRFPGSEWKPSFAPKCCMSFASCCATSSSRRLPVFVAETLDTTVDLAFFLSRFTCTRLDLPAFTFFPTPSACFAPSSINALAASSLFARAALLAASSCSRRTAALAFRLLSLAARRRCLLCAVASWTKPFCRSCSQVPAFCAVLAAAAFGWCRSKVERCLGRQVVAMVALCLRQS
mmetsp:Transcript_109200/g.216833  ORF Transcript_109200/g.216833 Transcript_109200/m.216833 type:complete len:229 (+) Transcript_109200:134-820(+)